MRFAISTLTPLDYPHTAAFAEVALCLAAGLQDLGHDAIVSTRLDNRRRRHIVLGSHLLLRHPVPVPDDALFYNLEQISPESKWFRGGLIDILRSRRCLDYSRQNIARLNALGITDTVHLPLGHHPRLERIGQADEDVDVLFYGSMNERRHQVLQQLRARGLRVEAAFNVYGAARDALVARAKIVLNMHYFESKVFEAVRVGYLLGNRRFVISEGGGSSDDESDYAHGLAFAPYDQLADACERYLQQPTERERIAEAGQQLMRQRPIAPLLERALVALEGGCDALRS